MSGTSFSVSSVQELYTALNNAQGGDTIELAAGTYDYVKIRDYSLLNAKFDETVTIKSADANNPAIINYMSVSGADNLKFEGLTFDYHYTSGDDFRTKAFEVLSSTNVAFSDCHFVGDIANIPDDPALDGLPTANGLFFRSCDNVLVENCEFEGFARGLMVGDCRDILVRNNEFHHQRMDHMANFQVTNMVIEDNYMHDHVAAPNSADHPDFIQFWNDGNPYSSSDVIIRNNIMVTGEGVNSTQVIYVSNGAVNRAGAGTEMFFKNFSITDNVIVGSHRNAICVDQVDGLVVARNTVIGEACVQGSDPLHIPGIVVRPESTNVVIVDNITPSIYNVQGQATWYVSHNLLIQDSDPLAPGYYGDVFVNPVEGSRSVLANIQIVPGSVAEGMGAWQLIYDDTPDEFTALAHLTRDAKAWTDFTFDAHYSAGPSGLLEAGATVLWDFGDGTHGTGMTARHSYSATGTYDVTMIIKSSQGTDVCAARVVVSDPEILRLDAAGHRMVFEDTGHEKSVAIQSYDPDGAGAAVAHDALIFANSKASYSVAASELPSLPSAQGFEIDMTLHSANWATGAGEILRIHNGVILAAKTDGTVATTVFLDDGSRHTLVSTESLATGDWSHLTVTFDGVAGSLSVTINGADAGHMALSGELSDNLSWGVYLGSNFGRPGFTGAISELTIDANQMAYEALGAASPAPVSAVAPAPVDILAAFDGFDLKQAVATGTPSVSFKGNAVGSADAVALLDGNGDYVQIDRAFAETDLGQQFTMIVDWEQAAGSADYSRLAWKHGQVSVETLNDGLRIKLLGADGTMKSFDLTELGLTKGESHELILSADEEADTLQVMVDDTLVLNETGTDFQFSAATDNHWMLGGAFGGWMNGEIDNFRLDNDAALDLFAAAQQQSQTFATAIDLLG